jgi:predicted nucleic acid-binding protein
VNYNYIIFDTSIIIALLNSKDEYHEWVTQSLRNINFKAKYITCEAVVTECYFLFKKFNDALSNLFYLFEDKIIEINFSLQRDISRVAGLIKKYDNVPMSLADACLVCMSENFDKSVVYTLDRDFLIYRKSNKNGIPLISPFN